MNKKGFFKIGIFFKIGKKVTSFSLGQESNFGPENTKKNLLQLSNYTPLLTFNIGSFNNVLFNGYS